MERREEEREKRANYTGISELQQLWVAVQEHFLIQGNKI
jgi:hypothetical protein